MSGQSAITDDIIGLGVSIVTQYPCQCCAMCIRIHRRRFVINIEGAKIWVTNMGGQKFWANLFSDKKSILSKISDDLFFSHRQLSYKIYTFHSKCTPFSL